MTQYGSTQHPFSFGSGGGSAVDYARVGRDGGAGGPGGGRIRVNATRIVDLPIYSLMRADGKRGVNTARTQGGGGSGGSVDVNAPRLVGNGWVTANGGSHTTYQPGAGGGGRIAVHVNEPVRGMLLHLPICVTNLTCSGGPCLYRRTRGYTCNRGVTIAFRWETRLLLAWGLRAPCSWRKAPTRR